MSRDRPSCAGWGGVVRELSQGRRGRSTASPKQISDQLLRLLVVISIQTGDVIAGGISPCAWFRSGMSCTGTSCG